MIASIVLLKGDQSQDTLPIKSPNITVEKGNGPPTVASLQEQWLMHFNLHY